MGHVAERQARPEQRRVKARRRGGVQAAPVQLQPRPCHGAERFCLQRVVDHAQHQLPVLFQRDGHRPMRDPAQKVRRAVQGVHDPTAPAGTAVGLLAQPTVVGVGAQQAVAQQRLGLVVGLRHEVALTLGVDGQQIAVVPMRLQQRSGCMGGVDRQGQVVGGTHRGSFQGAGRMPPAEATGAYRAPYTGLSVARCAPRGNLRAAPPGDKGGRRPTDPRPVTGEYRPCASSRQPSAPS